MGLFNLFGKKKKEAVVERSADPVETGSLHVTVLSDLGNIRTNNEDTGMFYKVADEQVIRAKGYLLLVADGMGGHNAGEVASRMAGEIISREYFKHANNGGVEKNLANAFTLANKTIFEKARADKSLSGMGTTCTALVVIGETVYYAHVGDSRAYIQKGDTITQITEVKPEAPPPPPAGALGMESGATGATDPKSDPPPPSPYCAGGGPYEYGSA